MSRSTLTLSRTCLAALVLAIPTTLTSIAMESESILLTEPDAPDPIRLEIRVDPVDHGLATGGWILTIRDDKSRGPLAERRFTSTYSRFEFWSSDLNGDGVREFGIVRGEGTGTNVREEYLEVFEWTGLSLRELLRIQVSGFFGVGQWRYRSSLEDTTGDGIDDLVLRLEHDPIEASTINDPSMIPAVHERRFGYREPFGLVELNRDDRR